MVTVRELSSELGVHQLDVTKALVALNSERSVADPLTDDEVKLVRTLLAHGGGPEDETGGAGVREPRRPKPSAPSVAAAASPEES